MNDHVFGALMRLIMCADPWPTSQEEHDLLEAWLNEQAKARGFKNWVEAYHSM